MASDHLSHRSFFLNRQEQQNHHRLVDPAIWRASAGTSVQIPSVHSRVYYFPQGHMEQASMAVTLSPLVASKPYILCRVLQVLFLADKDTDEVFAKILLEPVPTGFVTESGNCSGSGGSSIVSFAKILTPSDANNGGGFSVPRFCADSIFPPLDFESDPPVQNIQITDIHGGVWEFRHIYRGTPRRHLLTTGWSKFVNSKKLIAGDSVVFMKNKDTGGLSVGVRRAFKYSEASNWGQHNGAAVGAGAGGGSGASASVSASANPVGVTGGGFSRDGKGRVPPEVLVEAAERAANNLQFEVVYYPRVGLPDFVVAAEKVDFAMSVYWSAGMRVKMAMETEDSSRMTWFQGTIASVVVNENGLWRGTCWRMLEVAWDEPEILQTMKRVSPWQVEAVASTLPPAKRFRMEHSTGLLTDGEGSIPLPNIGFSPMMGQWSPSYLNYNTSPAGMQGARQNPFSGSNLQSIMNGTRPDNPLRNASQNVATELNLGSSSSGTLSYHSQNSVQCFTADSNGHQSSNSPRRRRIATIRLFGKIISTELPADDISTEDDELTEGNEEHSGSFLDVNLNDPTC